MVRVAALALLLNGCALGLTPPDACDTDAHCNPGRRCLDHRCVDEAAPCVEPACALFSLGPAVAAEGDAVEIEGIFEPNVQVTFPSGKVVMPSSLSAHRAVVTVPADAGAGELKLTSDGRAVGSLAFRRVAFAPAVVAGPRGEQASLARTRSTLTQPRARFGALSIGTSAYLFGGEDGAGVQLATVERATLNADGTISGFAAYDGSSLQKARAGAAVAVAGAWVYVAGGVGAGGTILSSIERAPLGSDGALGPFEAAGDLAYPRADAAAVILGNSLVIVGGRDELGAPSDAVSSAPIDARGQLGPFINEPPLKVARSGAAAVLAQGGLWVMGGRGSGGPLTSVERGAVDDAHLGGFTVDPVKMMTARERAAPLYLGHSLYLFGGEAEQGPLAAVERGDIAGGELGPFADAGTLAAPRSATAVLRGDNGVHLVGGRGASGALATTESLSLDSGATLGLFENVGTIAEPRKNQSAAVLGRWLYLVGGLDENGANTGEVVRAPIDADGTVEAFTKTGGTLKRPRMLHNLAVVGPSLFVLGGRTATTLEPVIERAAIAADGSLGSFEVETGTALITPRFSFMVVVQDGFLYALGGLDASGMPLKTIERAPLLPDGHLGPFESAGELAAERYGAAQVAVGDALYLAGGGYGTPPNLRYRSLERVRFAGDGTLLSVEALPLQLLEARVVTTAVFAGSRWHVFGGIAQGPLASIESASLSTDGNFAAFSASGNLTEPRTSGSAFVLGDFVYVLGGFAGPQPVEVLERAPLD